MQRPIYLDHHATTPTDPRVVEAMVPYFTEEFGNASSSTHAYGWRAEAVLEDARERLAAAIGAVGAREIIFTSGTTESDNLALQGVARAGRSQRDHLVTTAIEHPAVLETARALEAEGFGLSVVGVDHDGFVDPDAIAREITDRTALVSVISANSEIGTVQPLAQIGALCRERDVLFHSDAAQAIGKIPLDVEALGIDLVSFCGHKLYGPKGIGALYVRDRRPRIRLAPLFHGGGQEQGLRSGTVPVALAVGLARAVELCEASLETDTARIGALRDRLLERLREDLEGVTVNGSLERRLAGNLNASFAGLEADVLLAALHDVALSAGSACASAKGEPSHVLTALGLSPELARGALRFGLGRGTTADEIERTADRVVEEVLAARAARSRHATARARPRSSIPR